MNRKDIIISAVLINAVLLFVIFVSSSKTDKKIENTTPITTENEYKPIEYITEEKIDKAVYQYEDKLQNKNINLENELISTKTIIVGKGDVLEKIAKNNNVSVEDIIKTNNLSNTNLQVGQELKIPLLESNKLESNISEKTKFYTIKSGDSPWSIAVKNKMQVEDLLKLNDITKEKAKKLKPGDKLKIE